MLTKTRYGGIIDLGKVEANSC